MPTGAQIGGALADIGAVQDRLSGASAASEVHGGQVAGDVQVLQGEVAEVTATLERMFEQRAEELLAEIGRATAALQAADWSGASRHAAEAAEAQLTTEVNQTVAAARTGVASLGTALRDQVGSFYDEVTGQFGAVMGSIRDAYAELARGTDLFAQNLAEADRTISYSG